MFMPKYLCPKDNFTVLLEQHNFSYSRYIYKHLHTTSVDKYLLHDFQLIAVS